MSYSGERYSLSKINGQNLSITQCGITVCDSLHNVPPRIYPEHAIHFILRGKGTYVVNDKVFNLGPGQGFLIMPDVINSYTADKDDPWEYIYIVFTGNGAEVLINNAGLDEDELTFNFENNDEFKQLLNSIHSSCKKQTAMGYESLGYFILAMSKLVSQNIPKKKKHSSVKQYMKMAKEYIEQHYSYNISIKELADHIGLERSYLYRIFMEKYNISPSEYINNFRLKKAEEMMHNRDLTLLNIALSSGFYDYSYFSKQFTKKYKISPGTYRKSLINKLSNSEN
jgi:AraC-like DNA-binding protein